MSKTDCGLISGKTLPIRRATCLRKLGPSKWCCFRCYSASRLDITTNYY